MNSGGRKKIAVVTPLFNDWSCLQPLLDTISRLPCHQYIFSIFVIDDCSVDEMPAHSVRYSGCIESVECIRLNCNLGHQRAIAVGLCKVAERAAFDAVIVMDVDGEDKPEDIPGLLSAHAANSNALVVAQRRKRSESLSFRIMYKNFKVLFRILTGKTIDFGNYCLIPGSKLNRLTYMRELWSHMGGALLKSRLPVVKVPTDRGLRYHGRSTMRLSSLVIHGFSAIAVFAETLFVRLIGFCCGLIGLAVILGAVAVVIRFATSAAIPGWATVVVGVAVIIAFQALTLLTIAAIIMIANRSVLPSTPAREAAHLVAYCRQLPASEVAGE